jgi:hypothetical protein
MHVCIYAHMYVCLYVCLNCILASSRDNDLSGVDMYVCMYVCMYDKKYRVSWLRDSPRILSPIVSYRCPPSRGNCYTSHSIYACRHIHTYIRIYMNFYSKYNI